MDIRKDSSRLYPGPHRWRRSPRSGPSSRRRRPPKPPEPPVEVKVDRVFDRWSRSDTPGCVVGVAVDGKPVLVKAYGMANLEYGIRLRPDTVFESGSVAKQFTAAAIALLCQDGKLSLDDPVRKHVPEVPDLREAHPHPPPPQPHQRPEKPMAVDGLVRAPDGPRRAHRRRDPGARRPDEGAELQARRRIPLLQHGLHASRRRRGPRLREEPGRVLPGETVQAAGDDANPVARRLHRDRPRPGHGLRAEGRRDVLHEHVLHQRHRQRRPADDGRRSPHLEREPRRSAGRRAGLSSTSSRPAAASTTASRTSTPRASSCRPTRACARSATAARRPGTRRSWPASRESHLSIAVLSNVTVSNPARLAHEVADIFLAGKIKEPAKPVAVPVPAATLKKYVGVYPRTADRRGGEGRARQGRQDPADRREPGRPPLGDDVRRGRRLAAGGVRDRPGRGAGQDDGIRTAGRSRVNGWPWPRSRRSRPSSRPLPGTYYCEEIDMTYRLYVEGGKLKGRFRPAQRFELSPIYTDAFEIGRRHRQVHPGRLGRSTDSSSTPAGSATSASSKGASGPRRDRARR